MSNLPKEVADALDAHAAIVDEFARDEDGDIIHSADFGDLWLVRVTYNTDFDGRPVDVTTVLELPQTLHGPFSTIEAANTWVQSYPDDTDVAEIDLVVMNKVRP